MSLPTISPRFSPIKTDSKLVRRLSPVLSNFGEKRNMESLGCPLHTKNALPCINEHQNFFFFYRSDFLNPYV
jgi:hypothetical protein